MQNIREQSLEWFYGKEPNTKVSLIPEADKKHIEILYMLNKILEKK